jgi:hypothetical protein
MNESAYIPNSRPPIEGRPVTRQKVCTTCGKEKPELEFQRLPRGNGTMPYCKQCAGDRIRKAKSPAKESETQAPPCEHKRLWTGSKSVIERMEPTLASLDLEELPLGEEYEVCQDCRFVRKGAYRLADLQDVLPSALENGAINQRLSRYGQELIERHTIRSQVEREELPSVVDYSVGFGGSPAGEPVDRDVNEEATVLGTDAMHEGLDERHLDDMHSVTRGEEPTTGETDAELAMGAISPGVKVVDADPRAEELMQALADMWAQRDKLNRKIRYAELELDNIRLRRRVAALEAKVGEL